MKLYIPLLASLLVCFGAQSQAPDTTVVQTFTYGSPQDAWFNFPPDSISWEKVLMKYTLKCHPAPGVGSPPYPCGEWDYLTYTYLYDHTGELDSNLFVHPSFLLGEQEPDSFAFSWSQSSFPVPVTEYQVSILDTLSGTFPDLGDNSIPLTVNAAGDQDVFRLRSLVRASELISAGAAAGNIAGLDLQWQPGSQSAIFHRFEIRLWLTSDSVPNLSGLANSPGTLVFSRLQFSPGEPLVFSPFLEWDGLSNILFEISYDQLIGSGLHCPLLGFDPGFQASQILMGRNSSLEFDGPDQVVIPDGALVALDSAVTICFWAFGDPADQPQNQVNFEAVDSAGLRVLNIHLPWSNGQVYWDAGNNGSSYDRINKPAQVQDYEGRWNHWAFTKNLASGSMKIFLNGNLFHSGSGKVFPMDGIVKSRLGSAANGGLNFDGSMDEFQVWAAELDQPTIQSWMFRAPDANHPNFSDLLLFYSFDQDSLLSAQDLSGGGFDGELAGIPDRNSFKGNQIFMNPVSSNWRPSTQWSIGDFVAQTDSVQVIQYEPAPLQMLVLYSDSLQPTLPTDTLLVYPSVPLVQASPGGFGLDTLAFLSDSVLFQNHWEYYGPPFEIVNRFELMRFITPYGINLDLGEEGFTWTYDVSDYMSLLHDSVHLSAGNWQELLDVKFLMIHGTPPRRPIFIRNLWSGNYGLSTFETSVAALNVELPEEPEQFRVLTRASGHGMAAPNNCAEFCPKIHSFWVNGVLRWQWYLWKACASNPLFPQGGTWIYDRAGWCPGTETDTYSFELTPLLNPADSQVVLDYNSEYDSGGNYVFESQLIGYSSPSFSRDVAVRNILAPSPDPTFGRFNPTCGRPSVFLQNTGSELVQTIDLVYGMHEDSLVAYSWAGELEFLDSLYLDLPPLPWSSMMVPDRAFILKVMAVNGLPDDYPQNNVFRSPMEPVKLVNSIPVVHFRTNGAAHESSWFVYDANRNVLFSRSNLENNTYYRDTLDFLTPGCYEIVLYDSDDDGISFWANDDGGGFFRVKRLIAGSFAELEPDFGREIRFPFVFNPDVEGLESARQKPEILVFPNPGNEHIQMEWTSNGDPSEIRIIDQLGRVVFEQKTDKEVSKLSLDVSSWKPGCYFVSIRSGAYNLVQKFMKGLSD